MNLWPIEIDELIEYHKRREQGDMMSDDFNGSAHHKRRREEWERVKANGTKYVPQPSAEIEWLEGELSAILSTVAPVENEGAIEYAAMVSSVRRIFEMDQDRYVDLRKRVEKRAAQLRTAISGCDGDVEKQA